MVTLHVNCNRKDRDTVRDLVKELGVKVKFVKGDTPCDSTKPVALLVLGLYTGEGSFLTSWVKGEYLAKKRPVVIVHGYKNPRHELYRLGLPVRKLDSNEAQGFTNRQFHNAVAGVPSSRSKLHRALRSAVAKAQVSG